VGVLAAAAIFASRAAEAADPPHVATAFYYGPRVPNELLSHFDRIVVEADALPRPPSGGRAQPFAYVSVGEVHPGRAWRKDVPAALILGQNGRWGSDIVDTRSAAWRDFLVERVVDPIYAQGYRGLFLDALDSHRLLAKGADDPAFAAGVAAIIRAIRARHPDLQILMNRGFDVLPLLDHPPDGLVAESLFRTHDGDAYRAVPPAETDRLREALRDVRARWKLPIVVIDYVRAGDRDLRRATAARIYAEGFDPYVSTPALDGVGVGRAEILPRRVLLLYKNHPEEGYLGAQDACVLVAPILEWMGYAVDYADVGGDLPDGDLADRYAGAVVLIAGGDVEEDKLRRWFLRRLDEGVRVAFLGSLGFAPDRALLARLGLREAATTAHRPLRVSAATEAIGFEARPRARTRDLPGFRTAVPGARPLLTLEDAAGETWSPVAVGDWGGIALDPYVLDEGLEEERRWILDPFRFLTEALGLGGIPAPDVTTESGRRILTAHVDGDAFVSRAERPDRAFAGEVILDEILSRYPIPQTVSVIEGEVGPAGLYPGDSPALEAIARRIFRLPWVEAASHTFSHPFDWAAAEAGQPSAVCSLPIPGYTFDRERDLRGSIAYIEARLLPPGKKVRVLLWSGDCSPGDASVALVAGLGVENVNGGGSTRTEDQPSLTRGSAMGIPKAGGAAYQVFAPVENENVFTHEWHGPFDGYAHAIETFELADSPRRMSPISIYYHFYSGTKTASLAALRRVYDWALAQPTARLYLSEYAAKVRAFQQVTIARRVDDGAWEIGDLGALRTLRVDPAWGWPDVDRSVGVAGVHDAPQGRYIHLASDTRDVLLVPSAKAPEGPYLDASNGRVLHWTKDERGGHSLSLVAHEPLTIDVGGARACALTTPAGVVRAERSGTIVRFSLATEETNDASLTCR
jgi:hypothetical protein